MTDDGLVPLSALQHYLYCPRQCALIHVEQQWEENRLTAEGRLLHERADRPGSARRAGVRTVTALAISDIELGISGIADVVEFHQTPTGEQPYAVEYKRGRPKAHRADEVQLCAQALCLESMFGRPIAEGALFYGSTRRRTAVALDATLRALTRTVIQEVREQFRSGVTPRAAYEARRCDACSLMDICQPHITSRNLSVADWLTKNLKD